MVLGLVAIIALFSAGFFELRDGRAVTSSETKSEAIMDSRLGLKLDWTGTDWRLSWNPDAPALLKATKGQLFVTDGTMQKTVDLDASDLHGGTIIYSPLTNDVVWKLQVTDANDSAALISESVRTVSGLPSLSGALTSQASASVPAHVISAPAETLGYLIKSNPATKLNVQKPDGKMNHFDDNSLASRMTAAPVAIPAVRPQALGVAGSPVKSSPSVATKVPELVPIIPAKSLQTDPVVPRAARKGAVFQAAQLIVGSNPSYPMSARRDGISGSVELHFKIGTDGTVHDLLTIKGSPILAQAAMEAVGNRRYKPALVDGVPSETDASATFDFKLN
jgi:TonB family protein